MDRHPARSEGVGFIVLESDKAAGLGIEFIQAAPQGANPEPSLFIRPQEGDDIIAETGRIRLPMLIMGKGFISRVKFVQTSVGAQPQYTPIILLNFINRGV